MELKPYERKSFKDTAIEVVSWIIIAAVIIVCVSLMFAGNSASGEWTVVYSEESMKIGELEMQMNELRIKKENCYNWLSYAQYKELDSGLVRYCTDWDDEIQVLRAQADELKHKSYMGLE